MFPWKSLFGDDAVALQEMDYQILLLANVVPILGASLVSPVLDSLIDPFGSSTANIGLMISVFTAPGIVMIPAAGIVADRYGRKSVLVYSLALFGSVGAAIAFTTDFFIVLGLRFLQGIAFSGMMPVITASIGDIYTGKAEATAQGLRITVAGLSATIFPLVGGLLVSVAWQYPFLLYAIALPIAAVVYLRFDEPTTIDGTVMADERTTGSYRQSLFRLVRRPRVFSLLVARALPTVTWIGFLTYNSIVVIQLMNGTSLEAGLLVAVGSTMFALTASQAGRVMALFNDRLSPLAGANICLIVGFATFLFAPDITVAAGGIATIGIGFGIAISLYRSLITGLTQDSFRAGIVGLAEAGGRVTSTVTPIAMGSLISAATPVIGFTSAIQLAGLSAAIVSGGGGLICLLVARVSSPTPAERSRD